MLTQRYYIRDIRPNKVKAKRTKINSLSGGYNTTVSNSSAPVMTWSGNLGDTATTTTGTWEGNPTSYLYRWEITTAPGVWETLFEYAFPYYVIDEGQQPQFTGQSMRVTVIASNSASSASETSNSIASLF